MTRVALLWHMHQPYYEDPLTGEHVLPWVRLHALKDYFGMVALLREFPDVRVTFNLVPSLLAQLEAFTSGRARDRYLDVGLKPVVDLTDAERAFLVSSFFDAQRTHLIDPYPRYAALLAKREQGSASRIDAMALARRYTDDELRDLQVWQKLAWVDPLYLDADPRVRGLVQKGQRFSEAEKLLVHEIENEILGRITPEYRAARERGQIELSTSPFYHPILPLLCDTDIYLRTHPHSRLPVRRFRRPEDAREQLARAREYHTRIFGAPPQGLWPSEGSVSDAVVALAGEAGFQWMATDELILARTLETTLDRDGQSHLLRPEVLYRPYRVQVGNANIACVFRDHVLSDLIGFTYASWEAEAAARDLVQRLVEGGRRFAARTGVDDAVIPIILDGENAWEHFAGGGRPFLRALYGLLASHPHLKTVTMSEACALPGPALNGIFPGSWIDANFSIWIGHPDDQKAWDQLANAREAIDAVGSEVDARRRQQALDSLLVAEGSDWFWWYGDDHSSRHDQEFDELFRRHVRNVYRALQIAAPEELFMTNISTQPAGADSTEPSGFVSPALDGEVTSYFEWLGAGCFEMSSASSTMHRASSHQGRLSVTAVYFGFSRQALSVRLDTRGRADELLAEGLEFSLKFLRPAGRRVSVRQQGRESPQVAVWERHEDGQWTRRPEMGSGTGAAAAQILEMQVPLTTLGASPRDTVQFFVAVYDGEVEIARYPPNRPIELAVPTEEFEALNWTT